MDGRSHSVWRRPEHPSELKEFWRVYDAHHDEIVDAMLRLATVDPELAPAISVLSHEEWTARQQRSHELARQALDGSWGPLEADLRAQGDVYARAGVSMRSWTSLVRASARVLTPLLVEAHAHDPQRLTGVLNAMHELVDYATGVIGEQYLSTRQQMAAASESERLRREQAARSMAERGESHAREQARQLHVLAEASRVFAAACLDPDNTLQAIARHCAELIGDGCSVQLVDDTGELRVRAFYCGDAEVHRLAHETFVGSRPPTNGLSTAVFRTGEPILIPVCGVHLMGALASSVYDQFLRRFPTCSLIAVPINAAGQRVGVTTLARYTPDRPYSRDDMAMLQDLASRAGLAMQNSRLYHDLQIAVQVRDDFLAMAGHELKTPLAALLMHVQSVQRAAVKSGLTQIAERLQKAASSAMRLEKLINQLLDVSRTVAGKLRLEPEPCDLGEMTREVVARFAESSASPIVIAGESSIRGIWDRSRIDQVLTNLLANALKYGQGRPVEIDLRRQDSAATVRVTDHGIGIPPEHQKKIFERFERAVTTREFAGFGLGLWITRQIVDACGGAIEVKSAPDQGSTFTVRLPLEHGPDHLT
jgi:signal transduction histidine kinase